MSQLCIGGGSHPSASANQLLSAFGIAGPFAIDDATALTFANDALPGGFTRCASPTDIGSYGWCAMAIACIKARALLFCTRIPGDVAQTQQLQQIASASNAQQLQTGMVAIQAASNIPVIGQGIAQIGSAIMGIFAHHAQAVKTQADALGTLCPAVSASLAQIDKAVETGAMTASQAQSYLSQLLQQFNAAIAQYIKTCNAFCYYSAILNAIVRSSPYVYAGTTMTDSSGTPVSTTGPVQNPVSAISPVFGGSGSPAQSSSSGIFLLAAAAAVAAIVVLR